MEKYKETPKHCTYLDSEYTKLITEIELAWTSPKDITVLIQDGGIYLSATTEDADYFAAIPFLSPVKIEEATAKYLEEGLLVIEAPLIDFLKSARKVTVEHQAD